MRNDNGKLAPAASETTVSPEVLGMLGVGDVAYIRPHSVEGRTVHLIFSANGEQIGGYDNRDVAFAACRQNDLEPLSVH